MSRSGDGGLGGEKGGVGEGKMCQNLLSGMCGGEKGGLGEVKMYHCYEK